jgi:Aspartyl protease
MGYIRKEIELCGTIKSKKVLALFDSGAGMNFIGSTFIDGESVDNLGISIYFEEKEIRLGNNNLINGRRVQFSKLMIDGIPYKDIEFIMMEDSSSDLFIGAYFMQQNDIILDLKNEKAIFRE